MLTTSKNAENFVLKLVLYFLFALFYTHDYDYVPSFVMFGNSSVSR